MTSKTLADEIERLAGENWQWWVGYEYTVETESLYDLGSFSTKAEAVRAGLRDTNPGEAFYIIEARTGDWEDGRDEDDREPFIESRNCERIVNALAALRKANPETPHGE